MAEVQEVEAGRGRQLHVALKGETLGLCVLVVGPLAQGVSGPGPGLVMLRASPEATGGACSLVVLGPDVRLWLWPLLSPRILHTGLRPSVRPSGWPSVTC